MRYIQIERNVYTFLFPPPYNPPPNTSYILTEKRYLIINKYNINN